MVLNHISPIDGRYAGKVTELQEFFSEHALFKYRVKVEILYFLELLETGVIANGKINEEQKISLLDIINNYSNDDSARIKEIEKTTRHDVKAVEYFIKEKVSAFRLEGLLEFIHFGLTSQDINNTATPMMMKDATDKVLLPLLSECSNNLRSLAMSTRNEPMLARTHGQPASPTTLGKELAVFVERLELQINKLRKIEFSGKFGGATGNFNAHKVAFPKLDWRKWSDRFLTERLGISRQQTTTQIAHYDEISEWCHCLIRINTVLTDLCRDVWTYISLEYFSQKSVKGEIGSSAMPHKVNPIDFENAEGNLGIANAILSYLAEKLPVSRLQRDLTDSTVLRNLGVPVAHMLISLKSIRSGLEKLELNHQKLTEDLESNWVILAEAIQTILRRENFKNPYETLKDLTRGKKSVTKQELHEFIASLDVEQSVKQELMDLSPFSYIGYASEF